MPLPRLLLPLLLAATPAAAAEPWADSALPARDGLQLWLDAARPDGDRVRADPVLARWADASGHGRHLRQPDAAARPTRLAVGDCAVVRFDGADDHLRAVKQGAELQSFTVIVAGVPRFNAGAFRGVLAFNAAGGRDYETGLNLDFGPATPPRFGTLNAEGRGFGGARNLRTAEGAYGAFSVLELASDAAEKRVTLTVDGRAEGSRPRAAGTVSLDEITVGARFFNNGTGPQRADGFARYDVAEVLVYDRALTPAECEAVRGYLNRKYATLKANPPPDGAGPPLVPVKDPPPVQAFAPGFTARKLPVSLPNVNNVKYRPDGALVALGYNGNVWLLRDADGDGLEESATLFWENKGTLTSPIGMDLTPPGYPHSQGVFVAAKGKVVLLADGDGDGKAEKEIVVAGGWTEQSVNIDVVGVAVDPRDGSVWFGRGTPNYANGYLVDKQGRAGYSLTDERGTIQRVAPDFKSREIVATGIRFPVGMRFNRRGDLFATEQEGATWLPNGNPFDELIHVQKGRHYGFPPRHPKHLPDVIDEPSTFDYGPQHQSTCGLNFNEPVRAGGPTFGPKEWAGDAIVTGYSRGKLWRTKLAPAAAGYVARTDLFACLNMLAADACVSPDGGLVVACHGGGPDWGSGPKGAGTLFKVAYTGREAPQPVLAWPAGPREVRVAFDRPLDPAQFQGAAKRIALTGGPFVRAGDRFESLWPGYAVVQAEKVAPRLDVPVRSVQLTPDRRTLVLATDPLGGAAHYALTLPAPPGAPPAGALPQHPQIDLDFDLSGCDASWADAAGRVVWSGWLPTPDLTVARQLTVGSADHDALWRLTADAGTLTVRTQLNMVDALRPAVQPGSRLDHEFPPERVTVTLAGASPATLDIAPKRGEFTPAEFRAAGGKLDVSYHTAEDGRARPLPLHRALVPWARPAAKGAEPAVALAPELAGGSWGRGRKLFHGEAAGCSKCHAVHGRGGAVGPDLSNLIHRDYASVLRDVTRPSFAINPDHLTYVVNLHDGRTLTGVVQSAGDNVTVADVKGALTTVRRADVESMAASAVSTMPEGLDKTLGPDGMRDLLTFLLTNPVSMPRDGNGTPPKPRTAAEVNAVLAGAPEPPASARPLRVVLVAGPKDHGPGEHDYPAWQKAWAELFAAADNTTVSTAWEWPAKEEFARADVMVFFQRGDWDARRAADVDAYLERGGGLVYVHWAVDGRKDAPGFARRIGLASVGGSVGYRHGPLTLDLNAAPNHPVLRNFGPKLQLVDESYWKMRGELPAERVLATSAEEGSPRPQVWSVERGRGRVFVSVPGHYSWTFDDPLFRVLLLRGIAWAAKEPVDRFNDLVRPGARVAE